MIDRQFKLPNRTRTLKNKEKPKQFSDGSSECNARKTLVEQMDASSERLRE